MKEYTLAPRELFEQMLKYMPMPTFDLIIEYGNQGVIVVKRKIAPYKNVWALPGLRMYKGESINETLVRMAKQEVGLGINPDNKRFVGQFVGSFQTEHNRQDISTCYVVRTEGKLPIILNGDHFTSFRVVKTIPQPIGAMYKYYLGLYFQK